ncbi:MAG: DUF1059 domain-containing protein [Patescibacteria group bacterium]
MFTFACADLGTTCDFVAMAGTQEEVLTQAMEHATATHADAVATMKEAMSDEQMKEMLLGKMKEETA